jgi:hypothetical protein
MKVFDLGPNWDRFQASHQREASWLSRKAHTMSFAQQAVRRIDQDGKLADWQLTVIRQYLADEKSHA